VLAAKAVVEQGFQPGPAAEEPVDARRAFAAPIMVTLGSVGSSVMPHFLHSTWQWGLFLLLLLVGLAGLALTWVVGTRAGRGGSSATPRVAVPTARADG
jgi:hypothetical protein